MKTNKSVIHIIFLVSWFWLFLALIVVNIFLNIGLKNEKARNDRLETAIAEIEKQLPSGRVILELKK